MLSNGVKLWDHQTKAVQFARSKRAVGLSMPMGTGKTLTCAALVDEWKPRSILIVSTNSIAQDPDIWPRHLQKMITTPYECVVLAGKGPKARLSGYSNTPNKPTAYLINFESVWREPLASFLLRRPPDLLIVDESHHSKAPKGKLSIFLAKLGKLCAKRIAATGTFLMHSPLDAWAQCRILDLSVVGTSFHKFKTRYAVLGGYYGKEVLSGKNGVPWLDQEELASRLSRLWYTCEAPPLPFDVQTVTRKFKLSDDAVRAYNSLRDDFVLKMDEGTVSSPLAITRMMRVLQVCSGFTKTDDNPGGELGKIVHLDSGRSSLMSEVLQEIDQDERVVSIIGKFSFDLNSIKRAAEMAGRPYFEISGNASQAREWRSTPGAVLGLHPQSGAEGLDFTMAKYVVQYSYQHSVGTHDQALARVLRPPGENSPKTDTRFVINIVSDQEIEQIVLDSLQSHKNVIENLYRKMGKP